MTRPPSQISAEWGGNGDSAPAALFVKDRNISYLKFYIDARMYMAFHCVFIFQDGKSTLTVTVLELSALPLHSNRHRSPYSRKREVAMKNIIGFLN